MKKIILLPAIILISLFFSCANEDKKNESEPYPNYDTTSSMENINGSDTASSSQNGAGSFKNEDK